MQDKIALKLLAILIAIGVIHFFSIENILGIMRYAPYYKPVIFLMIFIWIWRLPNKRSHVKLHFQTEFYVWALVLGFLYLLSLFLGGVLNDFGNNPYILTFKGITRNLLMFVLPMVISVYARHYILSTVRPNKRKIVAILLTLFIALSQFSFNQYTTNGFEKELVMFLAGMVLPILAQEMLLTYLVYMAGPLPAVIYLLMTTTPFYVLEVIPDLEWLTSAFVKVLLPLFGMLVIHETYSSKAKLIKLRNQAKESAFGMFVFSIASVILIWFVVGVFPIFPRVILTGSMEPAIMPGDMVLIEFIDYQDVEIGDSILFSSGDIDILHRVIEINEDNNLFKTKGDNNRSPDPAWVVPEQIKGIQKGKIPYVGKLLVWLRSR